MNFSRKNPPKVLRGHFWWKARKKVNFRNLIGVDILLGQR